MTDATSARCIAVGSMDAIDEVVEMIWTSTADDSTDESASTQELDIERNESQHTPTRGRRRERDGRTAKKPIDDGDKNVVIQRRRYILLALSVIPLLAATIALAAALKSGTETSSNVYATTDKIIVTAPKQQEQSDAPTHAPSALAQEGIAATTDGPSHHPTPMPTISQTASPVKEATHPPVNLSFLANRSTNSPTLPNTPTSQPTELCVQIGVSCPPDSDQLTIIPTDDSYISPRMKRKNYGQAPVMYVDGRPGDVALMKFDLSCLESQMVTSAILKLWSVDGSPTGGVVHVLTHDEDSDWDQDSVKWENSPTIFGSQIARLRRVKTGVWNEVDITDALTAGQSFVTIMINSTGSNRAVYASKESQHPPQLLLKHEEHVIQAFSQPLIICEQPTVPSLTFPATYSVIIKEAYEDTNFAYKPNLSARYGVGERVDSLLKFSFYCTWTELIVKQAVLKLFVKGGTVNGGKLVNVLGPWTEEEVTWNNAPSNPTSFSEYIGRVRAGRWVEIDVTSAITSMQDYSVTFRIEGLHENPAVYGSREDGAEAPVLEISF